MHKREKTSSNIVILPLIFLCTIYPMITRLFLYDSGYEAFDWFDKTTVASDLFLWWKMTALELTGIILCIILAYIFISRRQKLKWNSELWLLFGYAALSLVSTLVSEYSAYSWSGAYEQFEPIWCTLIYVVIIVYINNLVQEQKQIKVILTALAIGTLVLSAIGALQAVGIDIVAGPIGQFFMLPSDAQGAQLQGTDLYDSLQP